MSPQLRLTLRCASILVGCASSVSAQCNDWAGPGFHRGGPTGPVYAQVAFDDGSGPKLYVGGEFVGAGDVFANGIAAWDGSNWTALGSGISGSSSARVLALAVLDLGNGPALYAGGHFDAVGGVPAVNVAMWNGSSWSAFGDGLPYGASPVLGYVQTLAAFDDGTGLALYAGGQFEPGPPYTNRNIARWDGAEWVGVGGFGMNGPVRALEIYDGGVGPRLYAAGPFTTIDGQSKPYVARWNGSTWTALLGVTGHATALAVHDAGSGPELYIAAFTFSSGSGRVARWDGTNLTPLAPSVQPASMVVHDDGVVGPRLYIGCPPAGGVTSIQSWNGTSWEATGNAYGLIGNVYSVASYDDGVSSRLFAGGNFDFPSPFDASLLASWDGASWSRVGTPTGPSGELFALGTFDSGAGPELIAGGYFKLAGTATSPAVARWDGAGWNHLAGSLLEGEVMHGFIAWDDGQGPALYCGGAFSHAGGVAGFNNIGRWNGSAWAQLGGGLPSNFGEAVTTFAVHDDGGGEALYAGGKFEASQGAPGNNIARWDGGAWSSLGSGTPQRVNALAVFDEGSGQRLFAGGNFQSAGGVVAPHLARWDGAAWSAVGGGLANNVEALAVFDDGSGAALYAGGKFTEAGGVSANRIARWDGASWSALGAGCDAQVEALAVFDDGRGPALYAGGLFTQAGGIAARRVARWDGTVWEALGTGVDGAVEALHVHDGGNGAALFIAGFFHEAGGRTSSFLARWGASACPPSAYCTAGTTSSGCVPAISGIGVPSASAASAFTIRVDALEGQKSGHIFYGLSGAVANPWSPSSSSFLCVKAPSQRTGSQDSGGTSGACDGAIELDWNAYLASHPSALGTPFSAGTDVWAQLYFRDPPAPKTTNLSDGLHFNIGP